MRLDKENAEQVSASMKSLLPFLQGEEHALFSKLAAQIATGECNESDLTFALTVIRLYVKKQTEGGDTSPSRQNKNRKDIKTNLEYLEEILSSMLLENNTMGAMKKTIGITQI